MRALALDPPLDGLVHRDEAIACVAALAAAIQSGAFARARHTLFVTAGAGVTIAVAVYRA